MPVLGYEMIKILEGLKSSARHQDHPP
jgi:hypothetical protein